MTEQLKRRDGLYSLTVTAHMLCSFVTFFTPIITRLYPANAALLAALSAAHIACQELEKQANLQKADGV